MCYRLSLFGLLFQPFSGMARSVSSHNEWSNALSDTTKESRLGISSFCYLPFFTPRNPFGGAEFVGGIQLVIELEAID